MSRIGIQPVKILNGAEIKMESENIKVKGPKGELSQWIDPRINIEVLKDKNEVVLSIKNKEDQFKVKNLWGLYRVLIFNMIQGVTQGFSKELVIEGVGYNFSVQDKKLVLNIGFSHTVDYVLKPGIEAKVEKNSLIISGIDKQIVGQVAAEIRGKKPAEPYKGKGIRYKDEVVRRKIGKKAAGSGEGKE